jgi:AmmeMemoRadiSam system protein B
MTIRPPAVAGSWYPASAGALTREVDDYVGAASDGPRGETLAIVAPHAGIMFSGPVGAHAYKVAARGHYDVAVLVGPSHFVAFDGVALYPHGAFGSPLGPVAIDSATASAIARAPIVREMPSAHAREHSLEMQLPFLKHLMPDLPIVPLLMGRQRRETIDALADALVGGLGATRALLVASTDLSHYFDAVTAAKLDAQVRACVAELNPDRLLTLFETYPEDERGRHVGCGIGPAIAVMRAARALGASDARILKYAHSGDVSGDYSGVVGYLAAAMGRYDAD